MTEDELIARLEYLTARLIAAEGTPHYSRMERLTLIALDALLAEHYRAPARVAWPGEDE